MFVLLLAIAGCAKAEPSPPLPPPYELPLYDGANRDYLPPQGELFRPEKPSPRGLFDTVLSCYPARSWFRLELSLDARAYQQQSAGTTSTIATYDAATGTLQQMANRSIGLVARIPLYSADELDRERLQEMKRREAAAVAVGDFGLALTSYSNNNRHLAMQRSLERRAQKRVALGVAMTQEQVDIMKAVGSYETALATDLATLIKNRLILVSYCETGEKADALD
ncbi:MAG: hypothetical protein WAW41_06965, partial [Methylobacter sp.]